MALIAFFGPASVLMTGTMVYVYALHFEALSAYYGLSYAIGHDALGPMMMLASLAIWVSARTAGNPTPTLARGLAVAGVGWSVFAGAVNIHSNAFPLSLDGFLSFDANAAVVMTPLFAYAMWFVVAVWLVGRVPARAAS